MLDRTSDVALNIGQGNQTKSGAGYFQRSPQPSKYENENHRVSDICRLIFYAIGMLLSPLVVYMFFIGDERKCVRTDKSFGTSRCVDGKCIQVDRSFGTSISVVNAVVDIININFYELRDDLGKGARILHICWFMIRVIPQSVVMVILALATNIHTVWYGVIPLLLQASLRLIRLLKWSAKVIPPSASFGQWALKFFCSYACLAQVIGAMWYFGAIYNEDKYWQKACRNEDSGCSDRDFCDRFLSCNESLEAYKPTNNFCLTNTTEYDFGVFREAHQSGILEMRGSASVLKILYCFRWAMQTISGFGMNLEVVGTDVLGYLFAIFIILATVTLFYHLLGQMQVCMQFDTETENGRNKKLQETKQLMPIKRLFKGLQTEVTEQKHSQMTRQLCLELLRKVEEFQNWDDASLDNLNAYLKPVSYSEQAVIIRKNDPIDKIIFVVQGKLWVYTSGFEESPTRSIKTYDSSIVATTIESLSTVLNDQRNDHLNEVLLCGELLSWLRTSPSMLPVSKITIQAVTKVEAFVLMAYDLKNIFIKRREAQTVAQGATTVKPVVAKPRCKN